MKMFATIMIVLGLATMALNIFSAGQLETKNAVALVLGGTAIVVGLFMRSRAKEGIGMTEITVKDRMEFQKARNKLNLRSLLGRLIGTFGALFIFVGLYSPFMTEPSHKWDWGAATGVMVVGIFLLFCAALIENPAMLRNCPPAWYPAVSGFACSCSVLALTVCVVVTWRSSPGDPPKWVRSVLALSLVGGSLAAIVCILTGIAAVVRWKAKRGEMKQPVDIR
jgi:hypothetical protein